MEQVEDLHLILCHLIATEVRSTFHQRRISYLVNRQRHLTHHSDGALQSLADRLSALLPVTLITIMVLDEERKFWTIRATSSIRLLDSASPPGNRIPVGWLPTYNRALEEGHPLLFRQHDPLHLLGEEELNLTLESHVKSGAILPLPTDGPAQGVVAIGEIRGWERNPVTEDLLRAGWQAVQEWHGLLEGESMLPLRMPSRAEAVV
jgi:hypothetical protein